LSHQKDGHYSSSEKYGFSSRTDGGLGVNFKRRMNIIIHIKKLLANFPKKCYFLEQENDKK